MDDLAVLVSFDDAPVALQQYMVYSPCLGVVEAL
jgi:hypothetical protein